MANTGYTTLVNRVETDLINIFDTLTGTKLTYNTNYATSAGLDLRDIFEPYVEGDASANPTKYTTLSGGVEKDLNVIFKKISPLFPTLGGSLANQFAQVSSIYNNNAIVGLYDGLGIYYSSDYGKTYAQSTGISGTIGPTVILGVSIYGQRAITHTETLVFYSSDAGQSWTQVATANLPGVSGRRGYQGCSIYENYAIIADWHGKIYVSNDFGVTWATISGDTSGSYRTPSISYDPVGAKYIAVCTTLGNYMWYCTNFTGVAGNTFQHSYSIPTSYGVSLVGLKGISGAGLSGGMYYTTDGGQTWTKATDASGTTSSTTNVGTYMVGLSANGVGIAAGSSNAYYVTKNFGQSWSQPSSTTYGYSNAIHNGNAVMYGGNNPSRAYYGKISL